MSKVTPKTYRLSKNPYLVTSLDISIGHITLKDCNLLKDADKGESTNPIVAYEYTYGYNVYAEKDPGIIRAIREYGYSKEFVSILKRAVKLKCTYIKFDGGGIVYEDLKTFDL